MITIRKSSEADAHDVLRRSPVADVPGADAILLDCIRRSIDIRCGLYNDRVACMWGLIPASLLSDKAYLWLLTTSLVDEHKFTFVRQSQLYIEHMLKRYPTIYGDVLVENKRAQRWMKWLGAELGSAKDGKIPFVIRRKDG